MNEAGVFGRFVPDFGRVVAQMQFDMYHHYTVDEHSIRAIGLCRGSSAANWPRTIRCRPRCSARSPRAACFMSRCCCMTSPRAAAATIANWAPKWRCKLCPRFGLDEAETETVAWLVRYHLLLSNTAFRRDIADPKTVEDFVRIVQSPERLRLLLMLTVVDIRAVGPSTWNDWKRQLLRTLFDAAEERLRLGHKQRGRHEQVEARQQQLAGALAWKASASRPTRGGCPTAIGWPNRPNGSSPMRCRSRRPRRISAKPSPRDRGAGRRRPARPGSRFRSRPAGPFLSHRRSAERRPAPRSSMPGSTPRAMAWRSTICWSPTARARPMTTARLRKRLANAPSTRRFGPADAAAAPAVKSPWPRSGFRGRAPRAGVRQGIFANHGGRGQCARPAGPARPPGACHPRGWPRTAFGPYRHLWRTGCRRILPDSRRRQETRATTRPSGCARRC